MYIFSLEEEPYKCINRTCQLDEEREKNVPPEYIKAGLFGHFYISEEELSWPQAQYDCQGREGLLAEVTGNCPNNCLWREWYHQSLDNFKL